MKRLALCVTFLYALCYAEEPFPHILMETSLGDVEMVLFPDAAPQACSNFLQLVQKKFYDGLLFHRIVKGYTIQAGDPSGTGKESVSSTCKPIPDEISDRYAFDMPGRVGLVSFGANRNGSQFFITLIETPWLTGKHTLFGQVIRGFSTLRALEASVFASDNSTVPSIIRITQQGVTNEKIDSIDCADPQPIGRAS